MALTTLIETVGVGTVLLVLIVCLPLIIKWLVKLNKFKQEQEAIINKYKKEGAAAATEKITLEQRLEHGSQRMEKLEKNDEAITKILENQNEQIRLLIDSDELDIKAYITEMYHYYIPKKYIDAEVMDLLESRFKIYQKEGGNGFAERMMKELRKLPLVRPQD